MKRSNYLTWENYFMSLALISSLRSKDPTTQVGACIVNPNNHRVLSLGYNGFPYGCSDDEFPWDKGNPNEEDNKYVYVVHAELNAILSSNKNLEGSTLYVTHSPCNNCAKAIIQAGIKKVIYLYSYDKDIKPTLIMFEAAGVEIEQFKSDKDNFEKFIDLFDQMRDI